MYGPRHNRTSFAFLFLFVGLLLLTVVSCKLSDNSLYGLSSEGEGTEEEELSVSYTVSGYYYKGEAISAVLPTKTGSPVSYSVSPPLPAGLTLNTSTGEISGTPTVLTPETTYTITATGETKSVFVDITFGVGLSLEVNSTADAGDANPGDEICDEGSGDCTLRAAIEEANATSVTTQVRIEVPAGTYTLSSQLDIDTPYIHIVGGGADTTILSGGNAVRVMEITDTTEAVIEGLSISNGRLTGNVGGAGLRIFITVPSTSTITLRDCKFSGNQAEFNGAGIENYDAELMIENCEFTSNSAISYLWASGGAIYSRGKTHILNSTFSGNYAFYAGGAASFIISDVDVENSTFMDNWVDDATAGDIAYRNGGTLSKTITITNSTFSNQIESSPVLSVTDVKASVILKNVTISHDTTGYSLYFINVVSVQMANNLVQTTGGGSSCFLSLLLTSLGGNLISDASCLGINAATDILNVTDALDAGGIGDNGGPTQTIPLSATSAAKDAGVSEHCPMTDQRGEPRPAGAGCDIGAFEVQ